MGVLVTAIRARILSPKEISGKMGYVLLIIFYDNRVVAIGFGPVTVAIGMLFGLVFD